MKTFVYVVLEGGGALYVRTLFIVVERGVYVHTFVLCY